MTPATDGSDISLTESRKRDSHVSENKVWLDIIKTKNNGYRETPKYVYNLTGYSKSGHRPQVAYTFYYKNEHYAKADQKRLVEELMTPRGRGIKFSFVTNEELEWADEMVQAELLTEYCAPRYTAPLATL